MARDRKSDKHRTIAERVAGRKLTRNEVVDHIDEDKSNNDPRNLRVVSRGAHTAQHNRARGLSKLRAALRMVKEGKKVY
jgi:hypothetical protein